VCDNESMTRRVTKGGSVVWQKLSMGGELAGVRI
jgi:hypothetical protein